MIKFTLSTKQFSESNYLHSASDLTITTYPHFEKEYFLLHFEDKKILINKEDLFKVLIATQ